MRSFCMLALLAGAVYSFPGFPDEDTWLEVSEEPEEHKVMFDGGSTGTKIFGWKDEGPSAAGAGKILTKCKPDGAAPSNSKFPLLGVAMLKYDSEIGTDETTTCVPTIQQTIAKWEGDVVEATSHDDLGEKFRTAAMAAATKLYQRLNTGGTKKKPRLPSNKDAMPILATAGNRFLSTKDNAKVWNQVCGKGVGLLKFHSDTKKWCRTIPGTLEAWYEWLATVNLKDGVKDSRTGMWSMGGTSAQIGVPLYGIEDFKSFKTLIKTVQLDKDFDCEKIFLPAYPADAPEKAQVLNDRGVKDSKNKCLADYIDLYTREEMVQKGYSKEIQDIAEKNEAWFKDNKLMGVGVISFLALHGHTQPEGGTGGLVAGGIIEAQNWASKLRGCGHSNPTATYATCLAAISTGLDTDPLYKHVKDWFKNNKHLKTNLKYLMFDTPNTDPKRGIIDEDIVKKVTGATEADYQIDKDYEAAGAKNGFKNAETMLKILKKYCSPQPKTGPLRQGVRATVPPQLQLSLADHMHGKMFGYKKERTCAAQIYGALYVDAFSKDAGDVAEAKMHFGPDMDWINGEVTHYQSTSELLQTRVHIAERKYMHGAKLHHDQAHSEAMEN